MIMVEFRDLAGLSEPLKKLIDVFAKGIGAVARPYLTRKNADAKAYEIRVIADAVAERQKLLGPITYEKGAVGMCSSDEARPALVGATLEQRAEARLLFQESKRQRNLEQIAAHAAEELMEEKSVSGDELDADWISRFFRISEDITTEAMQQLWGKVLAGEVREPGSYSLRALDLLKNLSQSDAELFVRFSRYAISTGEVGAAFVINPDNGKYIQETLGFAFSDYLRLRELGLLVPVDLWVQFSSPISFLNCGKTSIVIEGSEEIEHPRITVISYTSVGEELLGLVEPNPADLDYIRKVVAPLRRECVQIRTGVWVKDPVTGIRKASTEELTP